MQYYQNYSQTTQIQRTIWKDTITQSRTLPYPVYMITSFYLLNIIQYLVVVSMIIMVSNSYLSHQSMGHSALQKAELTVPPFKMALNPNHEK